MDTDEGYLLELEREQRETRNLLSQLQKINKRRLSITYNNGQYEVSDKKGVLVSSLDLLDAIERI